MFVDIFKTEKKYNIIYADPPWKYKDSSCQGNAEKHYKTMKLSDICKLPIKEITDNDCVLFLWATYPMMKEALEVISNWGFEYKTLGFQWIKLNKNSGGVLLWHRSLDKSKHRSLFACNKRQAA